MPKVHSIFEETTTKSYKMKDQDSKKRTLEDLGKQKIKGSYPTKKPI